jgi:hypothetical protein
MNGTKVVHTHEAHDAMLAAGLPGFAQIQKDTWSAVDAVARNERGAD